LQLRAHFGALGSKAKEYQPYRPEGLPAKMVAVANFKGGVGKTSTAAHLAMSAALDGYKVLVIDLDSQGSMTSIFGGTVPDEWSTVFPLLARDYGQHLRRENQRRLERGEAPLPLDDTLSEALDITAQSLIQSTHWPNIDLLGAQLNLYWAEFQIPVWRMQARSWKLWDALTSSLDADGVLDAYDLIFIDTPPALGYLTINGLAASDILLVPLGASFLEFDSTGRFFDMLHSTFASIEEGENIAARALGRDELAFEWDAVRAVVTRYDGAQQAELAGLMQAYLGRTLSPHRQDFTALIGQAGEQVNGIYEADYRDFNRETYVSVEAGVYDSHKTALQSLFSAASRAKRSKIKSFVPVVAALGSALQFPAQLGERLGLQLSKLIEADPEVAAQLAARLQGAPAATVEAEQDMLSAALKADRASPRPGKFKKSPRRISPVHGVVVSTEGSTISLKGTRVDAAFYNDLLLWLKQRG